MTENERNLWDRFSDGDEAARKELILFYLPLADLLAKRIARSAGWANWEDLRQDGIIGLMKAVARFDPGRGVKFKTFARHYIKGEILDSPELTRDLARRQEEICRRVRQAEAELTSALQRIPTIEEVAERTELTIEQINSAIDARGVAFAAGLPDAQDWAATSRIEPERTEETMLIKDALSLLDEREAQIVIYFYLEGQSTQEIAARLGLTVDNTNKIRQRAIIKLRNLLGGKEGWAK